MWKSKIDKNSSPRGKKRNAQPAPNEEATTEVFSICWGQPPHQSFMQSQNTLVLYQNHTLTV